MRQRPTAVGETARWLEKRFSLKRLRPHQAEVVQALLEGNRVLFVAPTGHGKSLCYQGLAAHPLKKGVVLVFQPLIALMQEQVERAKAQGLRAAVVNSQQEPDEQDEVLRSAADGKLDILFLSPERQGNHLWLEHVAEMEIKGVVIDEAHCISQWGHDFRPWYRRLVGTIMGLGHRTPVLAVTATAPAHVVEDIGAQIASEEHEVRVIRMPSHRGNLACSVWQVTGLAERLAALLHIARQQPTMPGIAYLLTTTETEMAADFLCRQDIPAVAYHGQLDPQERSERLRCWRDGEVAVVCATSALGMGVDRHDVRWVSHLGLPDSLIRYVQEIGRAGRDGEHARVISVHDPECENVYEGLLHSSQPDPQEYERVAAELRKGPHKRTQLIEELDLPETMAQRILDDLVSAKLCERDGEPAEYTWCGGRRSPVPENAVRAIEVRRGFLEGALAYPEAPGCRAVVLAGAMGDAVLPAPCGICDRCAREPLPNFSHEAVLARDYLDSFTPVLKKGRRGSSILHEGGQALAFYGMGALGAAIRSAKYSGAPAPVSVLNRALEVLQDAQGPYSGLRFDAVVCLPSTRSGNFVSGFAFALGRRLGIPSIVLEKTRQTEAQKNYRSRYCKQQNVRGAFRLPEGTRPLGHVLLVDDVWDSGASMLEAAGVLRPARVHVLTMARTRHIDDP
ncbi:RecQ family ATP-dependent DNA helicase [Pyxidicoccus xibeiensis]|uniref:RecQ family ATP-dependent DNA helicase n=1 Tax=Pyxidicoccus xibeiensis TaxID=2906759 RepID=UPI0020A70A34|nr:RecQ family ATP-dependent DNA helicase [Pyxidicoccus xibeiensis]MCP3136467.1 RecQ family ATP-dependent DNA helicase [Pyxidicoccus xibeiensis]